MIGTCEKVTDAQAPRMELRWEDGGKERLGLWRPSFLPLEHHARTLAPFLSLGFRSLWSLLNAFLTDVLLLFLSAYETIQ